MVSSHTLTRSTLSDSLRRHTPSREDLAAWSIHLGRQVTDVESLRRRLVAGPTLTAAFDKTSARHPEAVALTVAGHTLTHREVRDRSKTAAASLHARGVGPGSRVTILAEADTSTVIAYLGSLRAGAVVTFADPSLTKHELARVIAFSGAQTVLATGPALPQVVDAGADCPIVGLKESDRSIVDDVLGDEKTSDPPPHLADPEAEAILAFTSGSTGEPKAVPISHRNLLSSIRGAAFAWRWTAHDRLVHCLPIGHQHGLGGIHIALLTGSHSVILPRFDPQLLIDTIETQDATVLFAVPTIYQRLIREAPDEVASLRSLRLMISGSAPLPASVAKDVETLTGQLPLERYGSTETGLNVSNPYAGLRIPGTVGLPLPGVELEVIGPDGSPVPTGYPGAVVVRGPQVFRGYQGSPEQDEPVFLHGWFRTGDLGVIDKNSGHLELIGRVKETIITGGMNVHPREVENALREIPGVRDVAVIGTASARWGEAVTAFVVTDGLSATWISKAMSEKLAPFKRPKQIIEVAAIPRNEMGKVQSEVLGASVEIDTA
jgi:malonyl-CoA/methylmalonyl-CoA synthetase